MHRQKTAILRAFIRFLLSGIAVYGLRGQFLSGGSGYRVQGFGGRIIPGVVENTKFLVEDEVDPNRQRGEEDA
jgi:hypothetical protein